MNIFIDGEWNSYGGELISLALVAEDGRSFYEVLGCDNPDPWVAEHVMPKLGKPWIALQSLQEQLELFLSQFDCVNIIADWPEDIAWFCKMLITGPGTRLDTPPLTMQVLRVDTVSSNPHHALYDALALRDWYEQAEKQEPVAWINKSRNLLSWDKFYADMTPLYTAPVDGVTISEERVDETAERKHMTDLASVGEVGVWGEREWVGLTDEEIEDLIYLYQKIDASNSPYFYRRGFARAIEAKLRDKNI